MDKEARAQLQSIIDAISPADRLEIAKLPHDLVILLHRGLGTLIRNRIRAGELGALFHWSCDKATGGGKSLDDVSWPILVAVWTALRSSSEGDIEVLAALSFQTETLPQVTSAFEEPASACERPGWAQSSR